MDIHKVCQGWRKIVTAGLAMAGLLYAAVPAYADANDSGWPSAGQNLGNTRYQNQSGGISAQSVGGLVQKWVFTTTSDVSATPAVDEQRVYWDLKAIFLRPVLLALIALINGVHYRSNPIDQNVRSAGVLG